MRSRGSFPTTTPAKFVDGDMRCSFCGKRKDQAKKLIAGPGVYICDECVDLCDDILLREGHPRRR